jgi:small subunit ribosomal protein S20
MPIIKSAKKRVKVAAKANTRNSRTRRSLRDSLKVFNKAIASGKPAEIAKAEKAAISAIDIASKKAVIHKNKAARQKSQLSARAKAAGFKPTKNPLKTSVKKAAPKTTRKTAPKK